MNRRRNDRWSRVFVLLIFVMVAVLAAERIIGEDRESMANEAVLPNATTSQTPILATDPQGEDYPFLPPTSAPQTPTLTPTVALTATPPAPLVEILIDDAIRQTEIVPVTRPTPIGAVSGLIARCPIPGKQFQYLFYDLASDNFRNLTGPFNPIAFSNSGSELAYKTGAVQQGLSAEAFADFPIPTQWKVDQNFFVLGADISQNTILVQRFGLVDPGIYWMDTVTKENRLLFDWSGTLSEVQTVRSLNAVLVQLPDEKNIENLFLVSLKTGVVDWLTQYETLSAKNGRISPNGRRLAYWTNEGVWLISLDGTFASLAFPGASHPSWAADSSRLAAVQDGMVKISNFEGTRLETIGTGVYGAYPEWIPGGTSIVFWRKSGVQCEWRLVNTDNSEEISLLNVNNNLCQPNRAFSYSNDGNWLEGLLPPSTGKNEQTGVYTCDLLSGTCQLLSYIRGYPCDRASWSVQKLAFAWDYTEDADGWRLIQQVSNQGVNNGIWELAGTGSFPVIGSPSNLGINSDLYSVLEITMRVDTGSEATLYIVTDASRQFDDQKSFRFPIIADGEFHRYRFNLANWMEWNGVVNGLRLRLTNDTDANIALDQVRLFAESN